MWRVVDERSMMVRKEVVVLIAMLVCIMEEGDG